MEPYSSWEILYGEPRPLSDCATFLGARFARGAMQQAAGDERCRSCPRPGCCAGPWPGWPLMGPGAARSTGGPGARAVVGGLSRNGGKTGMLLMA
jgi:hypothetical protein